MKNDSNKLTKTDRILILIRELLVAPDNTLNVFRIREILGNPSRAQWYKLIKELTSGAAERPALLLEVNGFSFQLNPIYRENSEF